MKKISFLLVACIFAIMATTQVSVQRIDANAIKAALLKHDEASQNPKKAAKAATWLKRADAYYNAGKEPVKSLYVGATQAAVEAVYGKTKKTAKVTIGGKEMTTLTYTYAIVYMYNGNVAGWRATRDIVKNAFVTAMQSYAKAAEVDPNALSKAEAGLEKITNYYREAGNILGSIEQYSLAANSYLLANRSMTSIDKKKGDANLLYLAGYLFTIDGAKNAKSYTAAERQLRAALKGGYNKIEAKDKSVPEDEKGRVYYYIYYTVMNGPGELTEKRLTELKTLLVKAVSQYPKNENIMSGLMNLYATHPEVGTPDEVLATIEKALATNPDNISVWYSRGRVYASMKNYDECIKSFENVIRLDPKSYNGYFYCGVFSTSKADEYNEVMREKTYTKQADYDADFKTLCEGYKVALPYFEKALELKPNDLPALEYLKSLYFRVREEEGMMDKYNKYNELHKSVSGQ